MADLVSPAPADDGPSIRSYVVAHDGGERGRDALALGAVLSRSLAVELEVVFVVRTDDPFAGPYPPVGDVTGLVAETGQEFLDEELAALPGDVVARSHVRTAESVPEGLLAAVEEFGAAAVVVGAGGRNPLGVGPVARALLHSSPVPVVLAAETPGVERIDTLYVALGTRPGAEAVLAEAQEGADRAGLPLHVVSLLDLDGRAEEGGSSRQRVEELLAGLTDASIHVGEGTSMAEAVASIDWEPGGLLLVGSSRLARGRQTFLGPTAARMIRHVPVPVVVVPRAEVAR
ncbi:universal stress protein [Kineococcus gynurae]|uniref:Universal stress protein n=1 Tax=Kineococcus gynurae TaxID=452979 RepID=A0ABV5LP47_9ACTN